MHDGWPVEPPEGVGGLFLGLGTESSVALLATLLLSHYSFTARKSWSNRHQEERGRGREKRVLSVRQDEEGEGTEISVVLQNKAGLSMPKLYLKF